jgi:DNA-binding CsgD family transcriptional regulator
MLARGDSGSAALSDVLQQLGTAAILLDAEGEVVGFNDAAQDCIGSEFHIRNRRLIVAHPDSNRALAGLIKKTLDAESGCPEQVVISRHNTRPLILRTVRLCGRTVPLFHPARAIVMVLNASRAILPTEAQVKSAFGLSSGESRLVICLAGGETLQRAAAACGISYETARKRIKVVFEKTDTRRQSELIALVIRIGMLAGAPAVAAAKAKPAGPARPQLRHYPPAFVNKPSESTPSDEILRL